MDKATIGEERRVTVKGAVTDCRFDQLKGTVYINGASHSASEGRILASLIGFYLRQSTQSPMSSTQWISLLVRYLLLQLFLTRLLPPGGASVRGAYVHHPLSYCRLYTFTLA